MKNRNWNPINWYALIIVMLVAACSISFLATYAIQMSVWKFLLITVFIIIFFVWMVIEIIMSSYRK